MMGRSKYQLRRPCAVGQWCFKGSSYGKGSRNARNNLEWDRVLPEKPDLLTGAAEDKGVAGLQPDHRVSFPLGMLQHQFVDALLRNSRLTTSLADWNDVRRRTSQS